MGQRGTVYLLHFPVPYRHARHYMGFATNLEARLKQHRNGTGARLMAVIRDAGLTFVLARTWEGDRHLERQLKKQGGHARKCPICKEEARNGSTDNSGAS